MKNPYVKYVVAGVLSIVALIVVLMIALPTYNRYQARANANNRVKVTAIEIRNQAQRVKIAKQQADIRYQQSIGIKRAQDEIRKTLTPLYVQFEMTEALKQIAVSGRNSSVIYIPSGPAGIPFIEGAGAKVGAGSSTGK